jgi:hypothetical protein
MTTTGRNSPCPCGSGKKYKKCCLPKSAIQSTPLPAPASREVPARSAEAPARAGALRQDDVLDDDWEIESAESDDDRFWRLFWDRLSKAEVDEAIALAQDVIERRHDIDGEVAFSLVETLVDPLRRAGRTEMIDRIIERIREVHPGAYADEAHWLAFWRGENATLRPGGDLAGPLAVLLEHPDRGIDEFFRLSDRLRYHGRAEELVPAMLRALPRIERSREILDHGKWQYRELAFSLLLERHLRRDPELRSGDADFLHETAPVRDMDGGWLERIVVHASGRSTRRWHPRDFDGGAKARFGENLFLLTIEFGRALHCQWDWPSSRAELGRERINRYLAENFDRRSERKAHRPGSVDGASWRLRPGPRSADNFVESHLDFVGARPYPAAVFVQALFRWLDFTAERALLPADDARSVQRALTEQWHNLADVLDRYVYDPAMIRDVRDAAQVALS